jgi:hypothetical protein
VFANAGAHGYYRTAYPTELLKLMAPRVETDLTAPERLSLLDDQWALTRAGRHSVGDYLTLAAGHGREHNSGVLEEVGRRLGFVHDYLTTEATRPGLEAGSWPKAVLYGALLGALAYGTYDLTNLAVLKGFTVKVALVDMLWGVFVTAATSLAGYVGATLIDQFD